MGVGALSGIRVLDLSRVLAGPWCSQILGDFGADVLKVEKPGRGDDTRAWGPPFADGPDGEDRELSAYYLACNRNKRSAAIDLAHPEGAVLVRRLAAKADVLIENFKVGALGKYGLDHASLAKQNPRLVYCSITGFGQTGPYADRGGYDFVAQGMGGLMSITGAPEGPPTRVGIAITDLSTGLYACISIMMALRHAETTGQGQHIDLSLLDTQIALLANQGMSWLIGGKVPARMGNRHPTVVPYRTFDAADGTIVVAVGNDGQFRILCDELGLASLADDPRFATNSARIEHRDILEDMIRDVLKRRQKLELIASLSAKGVPVGPVNDIGQVFADPFVAARGAVHRFSATKGETSLPSLAFPGKLSATPATMQSPPPHVGEQTSEVLGDWLGLKQAEIDTLTACGVLR